MRVTKESRGRGRPRTEKPLIRRNIRADLDHWSTWQAASEAAGYESRSEWIRSVLNRAAKRLLK